MLDLESPNINLSIPKSVGFLVMEGKEVPFAEIAISASGPMMGDKIRLTGPDLAQTNGQYEYEVVRRSWRMQSADMSESHETNLEKPVLKSALFLYVRESI